MGDIYAAASETVTSKRGGTYAGAETHAVMGDGPLGAYAHVAEAVAVPAIRYSQAGIVVIAKVIGACRGTAVSRIVHRPRRTGVLAGIGLGSGWLRSSKCGRGQPNGGSQQDRFGGKLAAGHRSLLWGFAPQFNLFQSGIWEGSAGPPARKRHPVIGRSSCRGHDASSRCVRRVNGAPTSFPHQAATPVDGKAFEGHWGPLCPPVGATTRDEQWTVCRDMIRGGSNGLRAHFTRATIST